jgi:L-ribulose-5-phosphate 3-epimerase
MTRRQMLVGTVVSPALLHAVKAGASQPIICIFSKHLAALNWEELGKTAKEMGFGGIDLTVRKGGHVAPERAVDELPRAYETVVKHGLSVPMITTELTSQGDPTARPILSAAAKLAIPRYKLGYYKYSGTDVEVSLKSVRESVGGLVTLGKEVGMQAMYHNHSGANVGEAVWDIRDITKGMDPRWIGYYFDACHAIAEGGLYGWQNSLNIAVTRLKAIAVKDFFWEKSGREWKMQMCPLGEGMVAWPAVFKRLAETGFAGPISLHIEYKTQDEQAAIVRDLAVLKALVKQAYGQEGL